MDADGRIKKCIPYLGITAQIESAGSMQDAKVIDINEEDACVDKKIAPADSANVTLLKSTSLSFCRLKEHQCQIIEHKNEPHTGLRFIDKLTDEEMSILGLV